MPDENKKSSAGYDSKIEIAWEMTKVIYNRIYAHGGGGQTARKELQEIFTECLQTVIRAENEASAQENDDLISKRK